MLFSFQPIGLLQLTVVQSGSRASFRQQHKPFYIGLGFLFKYLLYFLRLMTPLLFKSLAAQLNISKDKGPVFISVDFSFGDESSQRGTFVVVEGFLVSIWSCGTNTGGRISSSGGVCEG